MHELKPLDTCTAEERRVCECIWARLHGGQKPGREKFFVRCQPSFSTLDPAVEPASSLGEVFAEFQSRIMQELTTRSHLLAEQEKAPSPGVTHA